MARIPRPAPHAIHTGALHYIPTEPEMWARNDAQAFPRVDLDAHILRGIVAGMSIDNLQTVIADARSADTRAMAARRLAARP